MYGLRKEVFALLVAGLLLTAAGTAVAQDSLGMSLLDARQSLDSFNDVAFIGDYMLVAAGWSGLLVVSGAGGENPDTVAQAGENEDRISTVCVQGDRVLAVGDNITVYDLSNPESPEELSRVDCPNNFDSRHVIWYQDWLFCFSPIGSIYIFLMDDDGNVRLDEVIHVFVFDPGNPAQLYHIAIWEDFLFAAYRYNDVSLLTAWDITNPDEPEQLNILEGLEFEYWGTELDVKDGVAAVTSRETLTLIDIDPPEEAEVLSTWSDPQDRNIYKPLLIENHLLLRAGLTTLLSLEIDEDFQVTPVDSIPLFSQSTPKLVNDGNTVTWADYAGGLSVLEIDGSGRLSEISNWDPVDVYQGCSWIGDMMLVGNVGTGVSIFDATAVDELSLLGSFLPEGQIGGMVTISNGEVGISKWYDDHPGFLPNVYTVWLITADPDDPFQPMIRGTIPTEGGWRCAFADDYFYTASHEGYQDYFLEVYDISNVDSPQLVGTIDVPTEYWISCIHRWNDYLYVFCQSGDTDLQLIVYSLTDPETPQEEADLILENGAGASALFGDDLLILTGAFGRTHIYSLENPIDPEFIGILFEHQFDLRALDFRGDYLLMRNSNSGLDPCAADTLEIYDISDTDNPERVAWYPVRGSSYGGYLEEDRILITWERGIGLFEWEPMVVEESRISELPANPSLSIYPNPANPDALVTLDLPAAGKVVVSVYDLLGREVEMLANGEYSPGRYAFRLAGDSVPASGIYFIRAESGDWQRTRKVVMMK